MPAYDGKTDESRERERRLRAVRTALQDVPLSKFVACEVQTLLEIFQANAGWSSIYSGEALLARLESRGVAQPG